MMFQWSIISLNKSYIGLDLYQLVGKSLSLLVNGKISDFKVYYPPGFEILVTACLSLLITPNFEQIYFFLKFIPIPFFSFYILIVSLIIKRIFRKNSFIFFGLIMVLTANYINMRFLHFTSSNLAIILIAISFLILLSNEPLYYLGFFITSVFFISPRVSMFHLITLFIFLVIKTLYSEKKYKRYFKELSKIVLLSVFLFLPYIIVIYSYNSNIFELAKDYFFLFERDFTNQIFYKPFDYFVLNIGIFINPIIKFLTSWIPEGVWSLNLKYYQHNSIIFSIFFIFALMGLFLSIRKHIKKNLRNIFIFMKSVIIIIFILYFIPLFFPITSILEKLPFWFWVRSLEFFTLPIIIMECFFLEFLLIKSKKLIIILKSKYDFFNRQYKRKIYSKFIRIDYILIITLIISSFSNYLIVKQSYYPWTEDSYFNEDQINTIFFINDKLPIGTKILVSDYKLVAGLNFNPIYNLLYNFEYIIWDFSVDDIYNITKNYIFMNNIKYILIDFQKINLSELNHFYNDENFSIIFQNSRNTILQSD